MTYSEFMAMIVNKGLKIQHYLVNKNSDKYYTIFTFDALIEYRVVINSIDHPTEVADFEASYLSGSNKRITKDVSIVKFKTDIGNTTLACTDSAWTEFFNVSAVDAREAAELTLFFRNTERFQVWLDSKLVISERLDRLALLLDANDKFQTDYIKLCRDSTGVVMIVTLNLKGTEASSMVIEQSMISGSDNLRMDGYILVHKNT